MSSEAHSSNATRAASGNTPAFTLSRDDVAAAFAFFDVAGTNVLTTASLKWRLSAFYPDLGTREYRFLVEDARAGGVCSANATAATTATANVKAGATTTAHASLPPERSVEHNNNNKDSSSSSSGKQHGAAAAAAATTAAGSDATAASANAQAAATAVSAKNASNNNATAAATTCTTAASATANTSSSTTPGLTLDQLWQLLDTFQRTYMGSAVTHEAEVATAAPAGGSAAMSNAPSPSPLPHGECGSASPRSAGAAATATLPSSSSAALFDPIHEAFQVYDPRHTHAVDVQVLQHIMARIGFGAMSEEEVSLLVRTADHDGDGKITLDDFRHLVCAKGQLPRQ